MIGFNIGSGKREAGSGTSASRATTPYPLPPTPSPRGFTLLIAIVLSVVAASITLAITTLAYKALLLSTAARESQFAFYAADTALECALYWDNGQPDHNKFAYTESYGSKTPLVCADATDIALTASSVDSHTVKYESEWFDVNTRIVNGVEVSDCAKIAVYKRDTVDDNGNTGFLYGEGVNVACDDLANPRAIERGIKAFY